MGVESYPRRSAQARRLLKAGHTPFQELDGHLYFHVTADRGDAVASLDSDLERRERKAAGKRRDQPTAAALRARERVARTVAKRLFVAALFTFLAVTFVQSRADDIGCGWDTACGLHYRGFSGIMAALVLSLGVAGFIALSIASRSHDRATTREVVESRMKAEKQSDQT